MSKRNETHSLHTRRSVLEHSKQTIHFTIHSVDEQTLDMTHF
jgi:hypothetical protein